MKLLIQIVFGVLLQLVAVADVTSPAAASMKTPEQKLKTYISRDFGSHGRVEVDKMFMKIIVPQDAEVIAVEPRPAVGLVNFEMAWQENGVLRQAYGSASVKIYAPIVVAKTVIRNNESFTKDNCSLQEREISPYKVTGFYDRLENLKSFRVKGYVTPGTVISPNHTQTPFLISSGESVELIRESPTVRVSIKAKALENGRENQWIRVENLSTRKVIQAKVINQGEVSFH
jgi:flagella basal body P-ring formation protein FlgA